MTKNRDKKVKLLGDYHTIINNYLRTKKVTLTPQGLNNALKVTRDDIYNWRRRPTPENQKFLKAYDEARYKISTHMLNKALIKPELIYQHWRLSHPNDFDLPTTETQEANSNIIINLPSVRNINNDSND